MFSYSRYLAHTTYHARIYKEHMLTHLLRERCQSPAALYRFWYLAASSSNAAKDALALHELWRANAFMSILILGKLKLTITFRYQRVYSTQHGQEAIMFYTNPAVANLSASRQIYLNHCSLLMEIYTDQHKVW